jgi:predicted transcriptional regulator
MADNKLLEHVADIVSSHVRNNSVAPGDLARLIQSVYASLAELGQAAEPVEETRDPAVSIRASIKPGAITCLECGAKMKMLKRHLSSDHALTPGAYRARWHLPSTYPMVAAEYSERRKQLALSIGLGRKPKAATTPAPANPGQNPPPPKLRA